MTTELGQSEPPRLPVCQLDVEDRDGLFTRKFGQCVVNRRLPNMQALLEELAELSKACDALCRHRTARPGEGREENRIHFFAIPFIVIMTDYIAGTLLANLNLFFQSSDEIVIRT